MNSFKIEKRNQFKCQNKSRLPIIHMHHSRSGTSSNVVWSSFFRAIFYSILSHSKSFAYRSSSAFFVAFFLSSAFIFSLLKNIKAFKYMLYKINPYSYFLRRVSCETNVCDTFFILISKNPVIYDLFVSLSSTDISSFNVN